ncbi:MAG: bifunctional acetate--CoA ligase family protein/GNAT family N-acetyltransferase [Sedimenticola sp.]|uniref:GNAT family N-acetyltransferase n=1 Tax=Sedimenticola thiotaurini TaxID=1543721 RepID=A0A558D704_9GAMM|nr:bifunctional acetate--CoA ligase family protein/GNAT family N-acetyltransferase [Sedimenticola sp.]TVT56799.1 MAG: GNAT family N-acetyltransferase [Sedimenticola thiotaurini]MCW8881543.1 bifunctional acetate--CoA ligase family protein/GNAT family N-acetyltransferase [Sedimenticola sp.]MCW8947431.1 bifunctional acetate--CoA ligase family protein/GNAT family N-acetyltransferase [Sedimenticola sp.]MCW8975309.1 bifunctional acetate--CoA ligase family protein/GNAT family N-acetyltransferase [Sedi
MGPHHLDTLFSPKSIAVFGASEKPDSVGTRVFKNLLQAGFKGELYPINPSHKTVQGHPCFKTIGDVEHPIDLAVIASPAKTVPGIIRQCGEQGVRAAVILTAGFRETGPAGARIEQSILETARHYNLRLVGPNCLGIMRPSVGLDATFLETPAPAGGLALVSQSGALCTAILDWAKPHQLGFSTVVSLGNATDIDFGDVLDYLASDYKTTAILLYIEGIHDARAFMSGLRTAARAKPVIVLKVGRHAKGSRAASTHTGAMIGSDDVFDAALERAGVVRAMTFGQLFAAAEILSAGKKVSGNRLAIITNGGGPGVLATDRAEDLRVEIAQLREDTVQLLDKHLPSTWSHSNPIDITGDAPAEIFGEAVKACINDPNVDGILTLFTPLPMSDPMAAAESVIAAAKERKGKPVLACWMGETRIRKAREKLSSEHIPSFITPERAVEAFAYLSRHCQNQKLLQQTPGPLSDLRDPDVEGVCLIMEAALAEGRTLLSDLESKAILRAFHIPCTQTIEASTPTQALVAAETVGFPVAMKVNSPDISHKSDVGGVRLNINTAPEVHSTFKSLIESVTKRHPEAKILGVTIEPMSASPNARELMVGVKRDPVFGPVIAFGSGGTAVEILRDSAVALPPLNSLLAQRLIARTRAAKLLESFRQMPKVKQEAVEHVLLRVSNMVCELPHIVEMDINPLLADERGVMAADVRIQIARPSNALIPYAHMAIHPYPSHLVNRLHLSDGTTLTIRPIRPEDADIEQEFVRSMSPEAKYFRFMQTIDELTPEMLARFTQPDYDREMALIAVITEEGIRTQLGVARYTVNPDSQSCEFALAVLDTKRRMGIGSRLMEALMEAARNRGIRMMEGEVLSDNNKMLSLMRRLGFAIRNSPEDTGIRIVERWL